MPDGPENVSDNESEEPQIVVLAPGDLTKEEAENIKKNIDLGMMQNQLFLKLKNIWFSLLFSWDFDLILT